MKRRVLLGVQAVVTLALFALLFHGFDWSAFERLFRFLPLWYYCASLGVILTGQVLYAVRWRALLTSTGAQVALPVVLRQYFIGTFLSNFLPSTFGGDLAKVYYLGREHGYRTIAASVVLDRMLGLGLLAALATVILWIEPVSHPRYAVARVALTGITAGAVGLVALSVLGTGGLARRVAVLGAQAVRVASHLQQFRLEMVAALRSASVWMQAVGTIVGYFMLVTLVYQAFIALETGRPPGFFAMLMAAASTAVLSNIPVTINGLGLREQLHVLLLEPLGVSKEVAVAISLLLFSHLLLASLIGGLLWMRAPALLPAQRRFGEPDKAG